MKIIAKIELGGLSYGCTKEQAVDMLLDFIKDGPEWFVERMREEAIVEPDHILDMLPDEEDLPERCRDCGDYRLSTCKGKECKTFMHYWNTYQEAGE